MLLVPDRKTARKCIERLRMKVVTTFYRRCLCGYRSLHEAVPTLQSQLPVTLGLLTEQHLSAYRAFRPDQDPRELHDRLARGHRCFATWYRGDLVDVSWVATERAHFPYLRCTLVFGPRDIYVYDSYSHPAYRGRGLYMAKATHIMRQAGIEGYERLVALIAIENKPARVVTKRLGIRFVGQYCCLRFGPWQWLWHESFTPEALPRLVAAASGSRPP